MILRDRKGRLWSSRLTIGSALFLRNECDVDVMAWLADWDVAIRDLANPETAAICVWGLLRENLERANITDQQFGGLISNNSHEDLAEAIIDDLRRFAEVPDTLPGHKGKGGRTSSEALWGRVWQNAGVLGVDPAPFTLGELIAMADTRTKVDSVRNAVLCSVINKAMGGRNEPEHYDGTGFLKHQAKTQDDVIQLDGIHELSKVLGVPVTERKVDGHQ